MLPVRSGGSSHSGDPHSPTCLIPSSSCPPALPLRQHILTGPAPLGHPGTGQEGRPSPHLHSSIRMLSRSAPLHGYLSPSAPAAGPKTRTLSAGQPAAGGQAVDVSRSQQAAGPDRRPVVARHAALPAPSLNSGQARVSSGTSSSQSPGSFLLPATTGPLGSSPICFPFSWPRPPPFLSLSYDLGQKKRSLSLKSLGEALTGMLGLSRVRRA